MIPHTLFTEKNAEKLKEVAEKLKQNSKYQKQFYSALKGTRIVVKSCFRIRKGKMDFVSKSKKGADIVGLGTVREGYNEGYVGVFIEKWLGEKKIILEIWS